MQIKTNSLTRLLAGVCMQLAMMVSRIRLGGATVVLLLVLSGCASVLPRNTVPLEAVGTAQIEGIPDARFWGDDISPHLKYEMDNLTPEEIRSGFPALYGQPHNYLAISGGGANGAFGAGVLGGWSATGNRPEFQMVTGISTGALIAPFAFLGSDFDHVLKEVYTTISTKDIVEKRPLLSLLTGDAAADTTPLQGLLEKYVNNEVIAAIGVEHRRGRGLYVGTTDLDYMRPMIWDIGAIAASGQPGAAKLVRKILLASASIPGAMPPVRIDVMVNGKTYDEMHVDGGTAAQVFVYPSSTDWSQVLKLLDVQGETTAYVIRNSRFKTSYKVVEPKVTPIAGRSISSLIRTQGIGDLYMIYMLTQRDGIDYQLAYIPDEFERQAEEPFDMDYMNELYELGYQMAVKGYPWIDEPPGWKVVQ